MNPSLRWQSVISGDDRTTIGQLARWGLGWLERPYRALVAVRNWSFDQNVRTPRRLGRSTISVGNLTTGGTGKTPFVIDLARRLGAGGLRPAVLLRGYKADVLGSDEAQMIRRELGQTATVATHRSRRLAARHTLDQNPQVDVFLLDDGFQHRQVYRDLDIVLVDATQPFGFGHILPRGTLREPAENLCRADAIIVTRGDLLTQSELDDLDRRIDLVAGQRPIAHTAYQWTQYADPEGDHESLDRLRGARVMGVCGIGNPRAFERSLRAHVGDVISVHILPDHYRYDSHRLNALLKDARVCHADAVVTTHKDMVKWKPLLGDRSAPIPVYYPVVSVTYLDGEPNVDTILQKVVSKSIRR